MTDPEIIDALGTQVMQWHKGLFGGTPCWMDAEPRPQAYTLNWNPLASDNDAMMVVDAMEARTFIEFSLIHDGMSWVAEFCDGIQRVCCSAPDRRRAICLAALKAVGMEV